MGIKLFVSTLCVALFIIVVAPGAFAATTTVSPGDSIQGAINAASPGDTIYVESGTYVENPEINKQLTLIGQDTGAGMPVVDGSGIPGDDAITITADNVWLEGFSVIATGYGDGIEVHTSNNTIKNVIACNNGGDGIYFEADNNTAIGCNASYNGYYGIYLYTWANNTTVSGCTLSYNAGSGIYFGGDSSTSTCNETMVNNNASYNGNQGIELYCITKGLVKDNVLIGNTFDSIKIVGAYPDAYTTNVIVTNNTVRDSGVNGIGLEYASNCLVAGNTLHSNTLGIELRYSNGINVTGNDVTFNNAGISILNPGYATHDNNTVQDNNVSYSTGEGAGSGFGISLSQTSYCLIKNNTVMGNNREGIWLDGLPADFIEVDGVWVYAEDNTVGGVISMPSDLYNNITGNLVVGNGNYGIYNNALTNVYWLNTIAGNYPGYDGPGTYKDVYDAGSQMYEYDIGTSTSWVVSHWNSTEIVPYSYRGTIYTDNFTGNYWGEYSGPDNNNDGIIDTPYVIEADEKNGIPYEFIDYYPMVLGAYFTAVPESGEAPLEVHFTDGSSGSPTGYQWNFGDSPANQTVKNPVHAYTAPGIYTVVLTTYYGSYNSSFQRIITVVEPLVADFDWNVDTGNDLLVHFQDLSTGYPEAWAWEFGDGTTSTSQDPSHTYTDYGTYTVNLTITNGTYSDSVSYDVTLVAPVPEPPVASFNANKTSGYAPLTVGFTDTSTGDPTSYEWNFGDGSDNVTTPSPTHTYGTPGTYTVTLTVTNEDGTSTFTMTITVNEVQGWKFRAYNNNTGVYDDGGIKPGNTQLWNFTTGGVVWSSPAVVDGIAYVGSYDGKVYALYTGNGTEKWNFTTGASVWSSPAVVDGIVYVGSYDGKVYALYANNGTEKWHFTIGYLVLSSPAVSDGVVYVGSYNNQVYALDASTGSEKWHFTTGDLAYSSPAIVDGIVYVGSYDDKVYALYAGNGTEKWNYTTGSHVQSSPAVSDGVVYVGSYDGKVYALDVSNGSEKWNFTTEDAVESSPAVVDGVVYVGSQDHKVYALDASTGSEKWNFTTEDHVLSSPAMANGVVYIGSYDYKLYALYAGNGSEKWHFTTEGSVHSSPAVANGVVYVGSNDGKVYAIGSESGPSPLPTLQFHQASYSVDEDAGSVTLTVDRTGSTDDAVSVSYTTADGSAHAGTNYVAPSPNPHVLNIAAGESSGTITIPISDDGLFAGPKSFTVTLSSPSGATLGSPTTATVTITNTNPAPVFTLSSSAYEVDEDDGSVTITIIRTNNAENVAAVTYSTSDGTAHAGVNYVSTSGTMNFNIGETSHTFTVPIIIDGVNTGDLSFNVHLASATSTPPIASIGTPGEATVTIHNVDVPILPVADFTSNVTTGVAPLTVHFTDLSTGNPTSWEWSFGDGTPNGTTEDIDHTYANPGVYAVTLTAYNVNGSRTIVKQGYISVWETFRVIQLNAGWNLISIPLSGPSVMESDLFNNTSLHIAMIAVFDTSGQVYSTYSGSTLDTNAPVTIDRGYFVYCTSPATLYVFGNVPAAHNIGIVQGWNMIGWSNESVIMASDVMDRLSSHSQMVARFDTTSQSFVTYVGDILDGDFDVKPTEGYFVNSNSTTELYVGGN